MLTYGDLSEENRAYHFEVAKNLIVGNIYTFCPAIQATPLANWPNRSRGAPKSLIVTAGEFIRWRVEGRFKDCLFLVQADPRFPVVAQLEYVVPLLFPVGTIVKQI